MSTTSDLFPTETAGLPEARAPELVGLGDGDELDLRIAPVAKRLGDATVRIPSSAVRGHLSTDSGVGLAL